MKNIGLVSRRKWLGHITVPPLAVSLCSLLFREPSVAAQQNPSKDIKGPARIYDVRDFGAKGDGTSLDTVAVQAAIDACHNDRGGTVLVPPGTFVVGTLELKSNVTLHLAAQGRLLGSPEIKHYRPGNGVPPSNGNIVLLSAANAENIRIEGLGTIDGNGGKFFTGRGDNTGPGQNSAEGYFQRPHLIVFFRCRNLQIGQVFLTASAYHCLRILRCSRVLIDGVRIYNRVNLNNDGFHFNSSEYVHMANCDVVCQDDACALFGGNRFVTITNCTFSTRWSIFRFGGGQAENITISNCVIYETYGCAIKMRCGPRSRLENISFSNIVMRDVTGPISIGLDSTGRSPSATAPPPVRGIVRNISFNGIHATVVAEGRQHQDLPWPQRFRTGEMRSCIVLNGVGTEVLENITFQDVHVRYEGGGTVEEAAREVPQLAGEYFEIGTPPAFGIYARNVRGLMMQNVRLEIAKPDQRPAVVFENVSDATINSLAAQSNMNAESVLRLRATTDVLVSASRVLSNAAAFVQLVGPQNRDITIDGGELSKASKAASYSQGATAKAIRLRL